jgi:hypothetical protein
LKTSSNPGDIVLNPFCGCGTTIAASQKRSRPWIGIDITHLAIMLIVCLQKVLDKTGLELRDGVQPAVVNVKHLKAAYYNPKEKIMKSYTHKEMETEIRSISGYYRYLGEIQLNIDGRKVLCTEGVGVIDSSCCGTGGCYFFEVAGYIVSWKKGIDGSGHAISDVIPVEDEEERKQIKKELQKIYPQAQVNFI